MKGTVTVVGKGQVKAHSYRAPADGLHVTTQLIETPKRIIAIDGQLTLEYADEVVEYARGLGKPLDRLIISHAHPDHFQGAGRFGVPIHALPETITAIGAMGDLTDPSGRAVPLADVMPGVKVVEGTDLIDGIPFVFDHLRGGEVADTLVVGLPEHRILAAQDVVSDRVHLWLADRDFAGWEANLSRLTSQHYETILPGHGAPVGPEIWTAVTDYLTIARDFADADADTYRAAMTERFPDHGGTEMIDLAFAHRAAPHS
ncbi:MBL fold metallo-hydrolase [Actinocorallia sp. API 0066]|uniref:MBL fold metallo-hydrolase n=1 Tax=Actinocorallia sp. API 0066 TaxID=2896846 RepID=UPI001E60E906|nr:MBL fold metallo-hydrolase [Actinocorallia sp. API 0066]MCD0452733.1 MBL fold metallo-hydrolase [Actinocorallia sp. API 0066]